MSEGKALAIVPRTLTEVSTLAEMLSKSNLLPDALKGKTADIAVQILAGNELGLSPMASIRGVHLIQGKPVLSADIMVALCLSSGLAEYFSCESETEAEVTYTTKRKGSPLVQRFTWSDNDTKAAGLNTKENWRLYKRQMRRARCKAVLARDVFPDVLAGVYDPDEIEVKATSTPAPPRPSNANTDATDAEIVSETTITEAEALATIAATTDVSVLKSLSSTFATLPGEARARIRVAYDARKAELSQPATETAA